MSREGICNKFQDKTISGSDEFFVLDFCLLYGDGPNGVWCIVRWPAVRPLSIGYSELLPSIVSIYSIPMMCVCVCGLV